MLISAPTAEAGHRIIWVDINGRRGPSRVIVSEGLEDPGRLMIDDAGRLFVADLGTSHQIKVFSQLGPTFGPTGHAQSSTNSVRGRLEDEVLRSGWIVLAHCWMPSQIHALLQTPEPNLASGMQHCLSGSDRVSNLVRRAEHRRRQSSGWRNTVQEIEASLGLNTEHKP